MDGIDTRQRILECGRRRFLEQGFKSAPLRGIVADAGFTLGAFYGYFKSKEDLFYALTDETAEGFGAIIASIAADMERLPPEQLLYRMLDCYIARLPELVDYILAHRDEMTLLLKCADGTKYGGLLDSMRWQNESRISVGVSRAGTGVHMPDGDTMDVLMRGYFNMLADIVTEETDRDKILTMMRDIALVYRNGIISLMEER